MSRTCAARTACSVGPAEGRLAGEHLVADDGEAIDIGARIHLALAERLFGGHVSGSADAGAGAGETAARPPVRERERHAEIGEHGVPIGEEDVLRLDVAMHDAARVGEIERVAELAQDPQRILHRERALALETVAQRLARDVGHDVVHERAAGARGDDRQDVRVHEHRDHLDLARRSA